MRVIYRSFRLLYLFTKYLPIIFVYLFLLSNKIKLFIISDLCAWNTYSFQNSDNIIFNLIITLNDKRFYRNLFYYRISNYYLTRFLNIFYKEERLFHINHDAYIGSALRLSHPFNTFLNAKSIGDNVEILHNVTIGYNGKDLNGPVIGNNVLVGCGAVIIGSISIGNNVNIGSNCAITKDVPSNCTVIGNPAIIVRENGKKIYVKL